MMLKKQCEKCGFEYEYEGFANLMVFCPCCNEFDYLSCEYGFGPVVPCRIYHGKNVVGMVSYNDACERVYRIDSETYNIHEVLQRKYLEALYEAKDIISELVKREEFGGVMNE